MKSTPSELTRRLRESDPLLHDRNLTAAETAQMRRVVIDAVNSQSVSTMRPGTFALAGAFVFAVVFSVTAAWKAGGRAAAVVADEASPRGSRVTQVHFSTPGGTRIIWTLDPAFRLSATQQ